MSTLAEVLGRPVNQGGTINYRDAALIAYVDQTRNIPDELVERNNNQIIAKFNRLDDFGKRAQRDNVKSLMTQAIINDHVSGQRDKERIIEDLEVAVGIVGRALSAHDYDLDEATLELVRRWWKQ